MKEAAAEGERTAGSLTNGFTIVGAGAIGSIVGAHLHQAGSRVVFVESNLDHVREVREQGLQISGHMSYHFRPVIHLPGEFNEPITTMLLAVKARHTIEALTPLAPLLTRDGCVVSLQNGLEEYKIAHLVGPERTVGAFLTFGGHYLKPGEIVHGGQGSFRIGELDGSHSTRLLGLQKAFSSLQPVEVTDNIFGYLWSKMALGAVYFATALVNADVPDILDQPIYLNLFAHLAAEVEKVAQSSGVHCESFDGFDPKVFRYDTSQDPEVVAKVWDAQRHYWNSHMQRRTGVWRDLAVHKRKTEVEELLDPIVTNGRKLGVPVPLVEAVIQFVRRVENGERELGWHNLEELNRLSIPKQDALARF